MALRTLEQVKTQLLISTTADDELLTQLQATAEAWIGTRTGRSFVGGTFTELHDGGRFVFLANFPVTSVTSVKVDRAGVFDDASLIPASAYAVIADRGVLVSRMLGGPGWTNAVQVVYATNAVPDDVSRAYVELIAHWYRLAKTSEHLGGLNVLSKAEATGETRYLSPNANIPTSVLRLLEPYRVPRM
jgi:uncharacterized phiE125 gp8 family phage protein